MLLADGTPLPCFSHIKQAERQRNNTTVSVVFFSQLTGNIEMTAVASVSPVHSGGTSAPSEGGGSIAPAISVGFLHGNLCHVVVGHSHTATEDSLIFLLELLVVDPVNDRIETGIAHRQPMTAEKQNVDVKEPANTIGSAEQNTRLTAQFSVAMSLRMDQRDVTGSHVICYFRFLNLSRGC